MDLLVAFIETNPPVAVLAVLLAIGGAYGTYRAGVKTATHRETVTNLIDGLGEDIARHAAHQEEQHDKIEKEIERIHARITSLRTDVKKELKTLHNEVTDLKVEIAKRK